MPQSSLTSIPQRRLYSQYNAAKQRSTVHNSILTEMQCWFHSLSDRDIICGKLCLHISNLIGDTILEHWRRRRWNQFSQALMSLCDSPSTSHMQIFEVHLCSLAHLHNYLLIQFISPFVEDTANTCKLKIRLTATHESTHFICPR